MRIRTAKSALVVVTGILLLGACGSKPDTHHPAPAASTRTPQEYRLALAQCMRDHGIDMPDPGADGSVSLAGDDPAALTAASKACQSTLGKPPAPDGTGAQTDEQRYAEQLKHAQCFRAHGVDVPDPQRGTAESLPLNAPPDVQKACLGRAFSTPGNAVTP